MGRPCRPPPTGMFRGADPDRPAASPPRLDLASTFCYPPSCPGSTTSRVRSSSPPLRQPFRPRCSTLSILGGHESMLGFPAKPDLQPSNEDRHGWRTPHLRYRRAEPTSQGSGRARFLDGLTAVLAAGGLVMMFSARADYARWPLLGLLLPGLRVLASSAYRQRLLAVLRGYRATIEAFSRGGCAVPWMPAIWLVAAPVFLLYLTNATIEGAIDTRPIIPTAVSLVREANWSLDEFDRPGQPRGLRPRTARSSSVSRSGEGGSTRPIRRGSWPLRSPVAAMARICGADLDAFWVQLRLEKITAALLGSLCLGLFFLAACRVGPPVGRDGGNRDAGRRVGNVQHGRDGAVAARGRRLLDPGRAPGRAAKLGPSAPRRDGRAGDRLRGAAGVPADGGHPGGRSGALDPRSRTSPGHRHHGRGRGLLPPLHGLLSRPLRKRPRAGHASART